MQRAAEYTIGEVARMASLTVRALHHYDEIGLLKPSVRTPAGYRQYGESDLRRLHQILAYRELGFSLEQIAAILDDCDDVREHLRRQRALLHERISRLQRMADSVEKTLEAYVSGINLSAEEMLEVFGDDDPNRWAEETEQRWGETEAYQQSRRRSATYGKEQWRQIKAEADAIETRLLDAYRLGAPATSVEAMDAAEAHRAHITRWFYEVAYPMHRCLAQLYVEDPRFTAHYDELAPGLAQYAHDAIQANADRHEA